ncbi:MAG: glycosyltransferase family 2 protein [Acidimicrobiales bacterium]
MSISKEGDDISPTTVSIIVPMLNERARIPACLAGLEAQTYPLERLEVLVVDGGSTDGSLDLVEELQEGRPWLRLVSNPDGRASAAFNRGVEAASGEVIVLLSSHGEVGSDFVELSVRSLAETRAGGVGGILRHTGDDPDGTAIGLAMTSPIGMASPFRYATTRRTVDTIGHPAYRRDVLEEVGPFDESLERNSDYELNHRIRRLGYELVFDPSIVTLYRPRGSLKELAKQFWWYGRWKAHVVHRHPDSLKLRHLAAPLLVGTVALSPVLYRTELGRSVVHAAAAGYPCTVLWATLTARPWARGARTSVFVLAFPVMHLAWGAGFLRTLIGVWRS